MVNRTGEPDLIKDVIIEVATHGFHRGLLALVRHKQCLIITVGAPVGIEPGIHTHCDTVKLRTNIRRIQLISMNIHLING